MSNVLPSKIYTTLSFRLLIIVVFCCGLQSVPSTADAQKSKLPVPEKAALKDAHDEVRKLFASDFQNARSKSKQVALAEKLLSLASETTEDSVTRYALLLEARDLASEAGSIELVMRAIDTQTELYAAVDDHSDRIDILEGLARRLRSSEELRRLSEVTHGLFRRLVEASDFPLAEKIAKIEMTAAGKSRDPKALTEARADKLEVNELIDRWDEFQKARQVIQKSPEDENANRIIGRFLAFILDDLQNAHTHLVKSGDQQLVQAIQEELQPPTDAAKQVSLADLWREIAQSLEDLNRQFALERSLSWYREAANDLTGIDKVRVDSRIAEFDLPLSETEPLYLTELEEFDVIGGPWGLGKGVKGARNRLPIILGGKEAKNGLGVHPPTSGFSQVKYLLDGRFGTFVSTVGLASEEGTTSRPVVFVLIGDGKILWKSKPFRNSQSLQSCAGDISGVKVLELRAACSGDHVNAHACWGDPYVMKARRLAPR